MSCFYPLKGYKVGVNPSGKPAYKIASYKSIGVRKDSNDNWTPIFDDIWSDKYSNIIRDSIDIPCGHCVGCFLDRSRQWADRCMLEASYHKCNCFITLTYDDFHLPKVNQLIDDDAVVTDSLIHPLVKRDFQLFMKRLRSHFSDTKIRFFACGEYGSKTFRPHYHAILFGIDFSDDRVLYKENFRGERLYNSPSLDKIWNKGYCVIAPVTWQTCAYVSRYCLKKRENNLVDFYDRFNVPPEFTIMSRKPGIARDYYEDNKDSIYRTEEIYISDLNGSKKCRPPKYFDKLYDVDYPSDYERIKLNRQKFAEIQRDLILDGTDLDFLDYLKVSEYNLSDKARIFKERSEI